MGLTGMGLTGMGLTGMGLTGMGLTGMDLSRMDRRIRPRDVAHGKRRERRLDSIGRLSGHGTTS